MGSCLGIHEPSQRNDLIIDVQAIIADDAWEEFTFASRRKCKRFRLKRSDYQIEVPMNYYHFEVTKQEFTPKQRLPSLLSSNAAQKARNSLELPHSDHPDQLGLKTEFRNDTDKDQTYNFRMERTRTASVQVSYQRGFSIGGTASFTLGLPKVLPGGELSAEANMTYEITSSKGQSFEETLTTEATSEIVVSENSHCTAQVVMEERRLLANFKVWVTMHMPQKAAVVQIKNKAGRVVFLKEITNLSMLFPDHTHIKLRDNSDEVREDAVQFIIHGFVDGMQLSNHYIHLKGRKLPSAGAKSRKRKPQIGDERDDSEDAGENREQEFADLQEMGFKPGFRA